MEAVHIFLVVHNILDIESHSQQASALKHVIHCWNANLSNIFPGLW